MDGQDAIKYIIENNIEGDIVECGIESGNFEVLWIEELKKYNHVRDIYMYDTFNGLTEPGINDFTCNDATLYKMDKNQVYDFWKDRIIDKDTNNWCYCSLENVKNRLRNTNYPENKLHYIVGDVLQTLQIKENIPEKIAILRLDTDWYESSKIELEVLYDKVVKGGVIIFDDYYHWDGQRKATDDFFINIGVNYDFVNIGNNKTAAIIKK